MTNSFYNPTGNPGSGSEGLSALIRGEFLLIGAAFDMVPAITTTGEYSTVINQTGSYTYTLPGYGGTFALTTDVATAVATETTRATAAEAALTTAITTEATRAGAAEGVLTTALSTETTRAETAEATNATAISTETARAEAAEAANAALPGRYLGTQTLAGSGTFTAVTGTNSVLVEGCGSGGAGGSAPASGNGVGSGGSSGSWAIARFTSHFSGVAYSVGAAATGAASSNGADGNQTTFGGSGNQLVIPGGLGGTEGVNEQAATQGAAPGGYPYVTGVATLLNSSTGTAGGTSLFLGSGGAHSQMGGTGAPGPWGGGTGAIVPAVTPNFYGPSGTGPGAGGGGGTGNSETGGDGAAGTLLVHQFS